MENTDDLGNAEDRHNTQLAEEIAKIQAYKKSLEEEFKGLDADDPEAAKQARNKLMELVPDAGETIMYLLNHSDSESVRANLAKFVFTEAMKAADAGKGGDALAELFKSLGKEPAPVE